MDNPDVFRETMKENRKRIRDVLVLKSRGVDHRAANLLDIPNWDQLSRVLNPDTNMKVIPIVNEIAALELQSIAQFRVNVSNLVADHDLLEKALDERDWIRLLQYGREKRTETTNILNNMALDAEIITIARRWWLGWGA